MNVTEVMVNGADHVGDSSPERGGTLAPERKSRFWQFK
jgi:hypothetical protein